MSCLQFYYLLPFYAFIFFAAVVIPMVFNISTGTGWMPVYNKVANGTGYADIIETRQIMEVHPIVKRKRCSYLSVLLCLVLFLSAAGAAEGRNLTRQEGQAMRLEDMGLFLGVGKDENGFTDFDLNRSPSREEAATMLVRALGKGAEAVGMAKSHPFTDVPVWADGYVSYAYSQGLTKGISDTAFGAGETATGAMYVTFMLRALGYTDGTDFTWDNPWPLAEDCGIVPETVDREDFLRADAVDVTVAALSA